MAHLDFDTGEEIDDGVLPSGRYVAMIVESTLNDTKRKDGKYLFFKARVIKGINEGSEITWYVNIVNKNKKAQAMGRQTLKNLIKACKLPPRQTDTEALHAIPIEIELSVNDDPRWGKQNNVESFYEYTSDGKVNIDSSSTESDSVEPWNE